jgi:hypothetical protein
VTSVSPSETSAAPAEVPLVTRAGVATVPV